MIETHLPPHAPLSDAELLRLYPRLRRFAAVVAPAEVGPDDLVQEALERLLAHDQGDIVHIEAYLRQTMVHLAANHRRRLGRWRRVVSRSEAMAADWNAATAQYPSDLSFLDELKPVARAVLFLHDVEGVDFATIARQLDITEAAAKQTAVRARRHLRNHIELETTT
jgi:RNA polymerase sigma factor (sigma-70 family)